MPIPYGLTGKQFEKRFRGLLEQHSLALLTDLRETLALPISETVTSSSIDIILDRYGESGPSIAMYFEGPNKKVDSTDPTIFPGRHLVLAANIGSIPAFDSRYFSDEDFGALHIQADVTKAWFAEWWWKAGGWDYPLPTDLAVRDDYGDGERVQLSPGH